MPTPVSSARQCLAAEAASALDEAVAVARRRAHAQTTSLHVVFGLLSNSSSSSAASPALLRDALSRARSSAYSPRLQFKALELCFGVALDRLPSSSSSSSSAASHQHQAPPPEEPPVSNSLMAAIKRSQANQRRHPDTFHLYQQQQQQGLCSSSSSSFSGVKVELQQLVLAILDDPVVSRVFGEAGFRSCDIKLAVLRPPPPILRFPRAARCPPLFLCNFSAGNDYDALTPRGFNFPFPGQLASDGGDENCRRIGEVLARKVNRNPMLVGIGAGEAARDFARAVERQNLAVLPPEICRLKFVSIEREISELAVDQSWTGTRLEELGRQAAEPGVVVGIGDLKGLVDLGDDAVHYLVSEMTRVLELQRERVWVMGWSATYETYMKFLSRFPLLDKDWDLQLLPITSLRPGMGGLPTKPQSLMESFVPFGGFFPTAHESNNPVSKRHQLTLRCKQCNDKYEQEFAILRGCSTSLEHKDQTSLPSWLQKAEIVSMNSVLDATKAKDDKSGLNAKVLDLQKKWSDYCQRLHWGCQMLESSDGQVLPPVVGLPCVLDKERSINLNSMNPGVTQSQSGFGSAVPMTVSLPKITAANQSISSPVVSEPKNTDLISKLQVRLSKSEQLQTEGLRSHHGSDLSIHDDRASPSSVTSVATDLVLGTVHEPSCTEERLAANTHTKHVEDFSPCSPAMKVINIPTQTLSGSKVCLSTSNMPQKFDPSNNKELCTSLLEKVGRQEEAISAISQAIISCRNGQERRRGATLKGAMWLSFLGPDRVAKKRAAAALAELIFGSRENLICIDLGYKDSIFHPNTICDQQEISKYDVEFRGKTIADQIAWEVGKKPCSVVFLGNVDKADVLVQNRLSQAIYTGKISDSHGREFGINNAIFVTTADRLRGKTSSQRNDSINFSEERILAAKRWQMKILIEHVSEVNGRSANAKELINSRQESRKEQSSVFVSKRKLDNFDYQEEKHEHLGTLKRACRLPNAFLDLNLPVEEAMENAADCSSSGSGSGTDETWVEEFLASMDETVNFKPFDFDGLADYILKEIGRRFCNIVCSECSLEIDVKAMEQIIAATWLLENKGDLNKWIEQVLCRSFIESKPMYTNKLSDRPVLRLVACEGALMEEHAPGVFLPSRIILE